MALLVVDRSNFKDFSSYYACRVVVLLSTFLLSFARFLFNHVRPRAAYRQNELIMPSRDLSSVNAILIAIRHDIAGHTKPIYSETRVTPWRQDKYYNAAKPLVLLLASR